VLLKMQSSATKKERKVFWFYTLKVVSGVALGIVFGFINPHIHLAIAILLSVMACIVIMSRLVFNLREPIIKLVLWYGTFSYIMNIIAFWAFVYNLFS